MSGGAGQFLGNTLHGGLAGGAAHAINPTLGNIYDTGLNAVAATMGGPAAGAGAMMPPGGGGGPLPQHSSGPVIMPQQTQATPPGSGGFQSLSPQLMRLIQMLAQQGGG